MRGAVAALVLLGCGSHPFVEEGVPDAGSDAKAADARAIEDASKAESGPNEWIVPPIATCAPQGSTCAGAPDAAIHASYRKDFFYPYARYPEASIPDPKDGGRVQIVATSKVGGAITQVTIDGQDADVALTTGALDWWHVWPPAPNAGDPLWIAFHSRLGKYDQTSSIPIEVKVGNASAVSGTFPIARAKVPITYATTSNDRSELLVFLQNRDSIAHTLAKLWVQGRDATAGSCIPKTMLAPGEPLFVHVPLCAPLAPGSAWTIVATFADGSESVAAGRTITTHFPIEYWPSSGECSIPGGSPSTWKEIQSHGFDTAFTQFDWSKCPNALAYQSFLDTQLVPNDFYALLTNGNDYPHTYEEADHTLGVLVADEADKNLGTPNDPNSGPKGLASKAKKLWSEMPSLATYSGGSRSRYDGAYAGVTDIQGMDFYVAACAPHITDFGNPPPLRGAYDYAVLTRENQMPNPTWIYAQGFSVAWNANVLGVAVDRQPTAAEMRVQVYSAIASGAKGIMWFQGNVAESAKNVRNQDTWTDIGRVNHEIRAVRRFLQAGDPIGAEVVGKDAIAEAIRARDAIVVPLFDIATTSTPNDLACASGQDVHFAVAQNAVGVRVGIPDDFGVADVFDLDPNGAATAVLPKVQGRVVELPAVTLDETRPTHLWVIAQTKNIRGEVTAAYK